MSDIHTPDQRRRNMAAIHSANTKPELALRRALWQNGFRYRVNDRRLPGSPDIVLPKYRTVIFVHGCFWHGHKGCKKYTVPKTRTEFWKEKIARNQERDQAVWRSLEAKGWFVIVVWGCELEKARFTETVESVAAQIVTNGEENKRLRNERKAAREALRAEHREKKLEREAALAAVSNQLEIPAGVARLASKEDTEEL